MVQLPPAFIEHIHDVLVGVFLPFDEKVNPAEHRDRGRIESALNRPFHGIGDHEFYPSLAEKAAALFHSMVCNHCFINGNKRTAVLTLDMFLMANTHILAMPSDEVYEMAKNTAQANQNNVSNEELIAQLTQKIGDNMVDVRLLSTPEMKQRLGDQHAKLLSHVIRSMDFGVKAVRSFTGLTLEEAANSPSN